MKVKKKVPTEMSNMNRADTVDKLREVVKTLS